MARSSSFVVSWPKNMNLSFVEPLPKDLDIYCNKCRLFMQNPHQTSCCGVHFCEDCHKKANATYIYNCNCPSCSSNEYNAFPDRAYQRRIKALEVHCIHCVKQCEWTGKLEDLSAHLNHREKKELYRRYEGCSYTEIRCKHDSCFSCYVERRLLKDHEENCKHRPAICTYCSIFKGTFEQVESHHKICDMFPVPCTNKDHKDFIIQRKNLQHHLGTVCPFQPIDCQFKWAGCNDRPKRKDERQHNATSQQDHLLLLAGACSQLKKENKELREQLEKDKEDLRKELNEANQKLDHLTQTSVKRLDHTVHGDLPVTGDENNPVCVKADGQPVFFFSEDHKCKMSVKIIKSRSLMSHYIELKVYRGGHRVIPQAKKMIIKSDKCDPQIFELNEADLAKRFRSEEYQNVYDPHIPGRYRAEDSISIIKVSLVYNF